MGSHTVFSQCVSQMGNIFNTIQVALCIHDVLASDRRSCGYNRKRGLRVKPQHISGSNCRDPSFFPWEVEEVGTSAEDHSISPNHPKRRLKTEKKNLEESSSSSHDPDLQRIEGELASNSTRALPLRRQRASSYSGRKVWKARSPKEPSA